MTRIQTFPYGEILAEEHAKKLAWKVAKLGFGFVTPNPAVGCVILSSEKKLIGVGYHQKFGGEHAEVEAITDCITRFGRDALNNATIFVTLEPCGHVGKKPSCAHFLTSFPLCAVVFGSNDPNPEVAGRGVAYLNSQNIQTYQDPTWAIETDRINSIFFHWIKHKTPYVAVKIATDASGAMGSHSTPTSPLQPIIITPKIIQLKAHELRQKYDSICVGNQTVFSDDPHLTNRSTSLPVNRHPLRVILDPSNKITASNQTFHVLNETIARTAIVTAMTSTENLPTLRPSAHVQTLKIETHAGNFDLRSLLENLHKNYQIYSILVEGGARTIGEFFNQKCVHKLYHYKNLTNLNLSEPIQWQGYIKSNFSLQPITTTEFPGQNCELLEYQVRF